MGGVVSGIFKRGIDEIAQVNPGNVINVKAIFQDSVEGYSRALFKATRHSFSKSMPPLSDQLISGVRGLDLIVHSRQVAASAMTASAVVAGVDVGAGAGYARPELSVGKATAGDDVQGTDDSLIFWLTNVARWSSSPEGRDSTPVTLWLSLAEDVIDSGVELCDVNATVERAFGNQLFTPIELETRFHSAWPKVNDLAGRVIVVLGGARQARIAYRKTPAPPFRRQPSVAMNGSGIVVTVSEGTIDDGAVDCGNILVWIGQYHSDELGSSVIWHSRRRVGSGTTPAATIDDGGNVVIAWQSTAQGSWELYCTVGKIVQRPGGTGEFDILLGTPSVYATGCRPTITISSTGGNIVAIHTRESNSDSLGWLSGKLVIGAAPGEISAIHWDAPADPVASASKNLIFPRGAEPSVVVRFDAHSAADVIAIVSYRKAKGHTRNHAERRGSMKNFSLKRRGSAPAMSRGSLANMTSPTSPSATDSNSSSLSPSQSPKEGSDTDFDDEAGQNGCIRQTLVRGVVFGSGSSDNLRQSIPKPPEELSSNGIEDENTSKPPTRITETIGSLLVVWQHGIEIDPDEDPTGPQNSKYYPTRNEAIVSDGDSVLRVSVTASNGQLVCRTNGGPESPVRLRQLCFVEAHRGEDDLLADSGVRFCGCVSKDEEFAAVGLASGRVLRMWRFNQNSCLRSAVNPNFPFTDGITSEWYQAYLDACSGRPVLSNSQERINIH